MTTTVFWLLLLTLTAAFIVRWHQASTRLDQDLAELDQSVDDDRAQLGGVA